MKRRSALFAASHALWFVCCGSVRGRTVSVNPQELTWLAEIQKPPKRFSSNAPKLTALCRQKDGTPIISKDQWLRRRAELKEEWLKFLGPMPAERKEAPKIEIIEEDRPEGLIRQRIRYEVEPGISTEAYLLKPLKVSGRAPGIVAFHSTVKESIRQPAGLTDEPEKAFGIQFARKGYVVLCPRNYLWPDNTRLAAAEEAERFLKRHPKTKGMGKMLHDGLVAVDVLASLAEVDADRLGAVGHSLGAKEVLYIAAFDERIKVSVSSEGGIGTKFSNWDAAWYLGEAIGKGNFKLEHHELLGLIAPRPFLLVGGESADGDRGWPFIAEALTVYELFGRPCRVGQYNHRKGHAIPPEAEKPIAEWFEAYL
jgi:hypothetical protein